MSHFTKLDRANIVSPDAFIKACAELGFTKVSRDTKIKDFYGGEMTADVAVSCGDRYHLAIKKNEKGTYDMVSDWWGVRTKNQSTMEKNGIGKDSDLQDFILRHTTKHTIIEKYRQQGFRATVTEDEEKNLNLQLVRY